jgi:ribosomal protein L23
MKDPRDVILAPVVSEKSYGLIESNVYTFTVAPTRRSPRSTTPSSRSSG